MKINLLKLKNFRNVKEADINFKNGINLICGDNGQGKSTILYALSLLLFDSMPGKLEDAINWQADFFEIYVEFAHAGKEFKEKLQYNGKASTRELFIDKDFYKGIDATKKLAEYFDPKLSLASMISFEGEIDLINVKPSERRENLKRIYNLDFKKGIKDIEEEVTQLETKDKVDIEKQIFSLESKSYDIVELMEVPLPEETYLKKQIEYKDLIVKKESFDREIREYEENTKKYNELKVEVEKEEKLVIENGLEVEKINTKVITDEKEFNTNLVEYSNKVSEQKNILDTTNFNENLDKITNEKSTIQLIRITKFNDVILKEKYLEKNCIENNLKNFQEKAELCKSGKCPTCERDFNSNEASVYEEKAKLENVLLLSVNEEIKKLEQEKTDNDKQIEEQNKLKQRLEILTEKEASEIKEIENKKKTINDKIEALKKEQESMITLFKSKQENSQNQIKNLNEKIENNKLLIKVSTEEISKLIASLPLKKPEMSLTIISDLNILDSNIKDYEKVITLNKKIGEDNAKIKGEKDSDEKKKSDLLRQKERIIGDIEDLNKVVVILRKEFPNYVLATLVKSLENGLNSFIDKTYGGRYKLKIIDKKDSIYICYGEKDKDTSLASGYERQLFSLAWKYSLSQLQKLGIIFCDEIDSQASEENSQKLFEVVGSMKELFNQIFIITHRENTKEILRNNYNAKIFIAENSSICTLN